MRAPYPLRHRQAGVVLPASLILLMLLTLIVGRTMGSSALEVRMTSATLGSEESFQYAESLIDTGKNDQPTVEAAFIANLTGSAPPSEDFTAPGDPTLTGTLTATYVDEIPTLFNDIVIDSPGLRSLHFELQADTTRPNNRFASRVRQGVRRLAPKLP